MGEWDAFSSEAGAEEILSSQFSQELSQQSQEPLPSSSAPEPSSAAEPQAPSVSEPSLSDAVSEQTQTQKPAESAGTYTVLTPVASGTEVYSGGGAQIDASNTSEGYVMVKYSGSVSKIRVQITRDGGSTYTYALNNSGSYEVFPLAQGSGGYSINIYENVSGNQYALALGQYISVSLRNSFLPFLYPNQYVNFYNGSQTVAKGARLASTASNDLEGVEQLFNTWEKEIAAVIVEPVGANMGVVPPKAGFLEGLRKLCTENGSLLIFDEVITGFRLSKAGAQEYFGIQSDLTTYGKIIGGGMPVGAYGGRKEVMEVVSPVGNVYQAGTLSGNPVAMAAGLAQLHYLNEHPEVYTHLNALGEKLYGGMEKMCEELQLPYQVNHVGSLGSLFFTDQPVVDYTSAKTSDTKKFAEYFRYMLGNGVYIASSQFEAMFISDAHTDEEIQHTLNIMHNYFEK